MHVTTKSGRRIELPSVEEDIQITEQAIADGTNWADIELAQFKPFEQSALPDDYKVIVREEAVARGRPKSKKPKILLSVRYSADVVEYFKSTGKGWQTRMDEVLQQYVISQR